MFILGAHMSIADGFAETARITGEDFECHAMQIFTKSPRGRFVKPINPQDAELFKELCKKHDINYVIAHSSYLLNFGKAISEVPWAFNDIKIDFDRMQTLGGQGIVVHIGKALDGERNKAINNVIENAKLIVEATKHTSIQYILENTAGQGSEVGFQLEELAKIWQGLKGFSPRLRACLDTAHIWAAGYDIATKAGAEKVLKEFDELIGIKTLSCFHFNDSQKDLGGKVDRHANIGDGTIKGYGLQTIAEFAEANSIPMILETPERHGKTHIDDIRLVKSWFTSGTSSKGSSPRSSRALSAKKSEALKVTSR